eukprot:6179406-Amphidinium_carterae.1
MTPCKKWSTSIGLSKVLASIVELTCALVAWGSDCVFIIVSGSCTPQVCPMLLIERGHLCHLHPRHTWILADAAGV